MDKIRWVALWLRGNLPKFKTKQLVIGLALVIAAICAWFYILNLLHDPPIVEKSFSKLSIEKEAPQEQGSEIDFLISSESPQSESGKKILKPKKPDPGLFRSKQVFVNSSYRKDLPRLKLPIRLETPIDTRDPGAVAEFVVTDSDLKRVPKGTRVLCKASYPGSRSRIFFGITELVTPSGEVLKPVGRVISMHDSLPGLRGKLHSGAFKKALKTMGLAVAGRGAEILSNRANRIPEHHSAEDLLRESAASSGVAASEGLISDELSRESVVFVTMIAGTKAVLSLP